MDKDPPICYADFEISDNDFNQIPGTLSGHGPGARTLRHLDASSQPYRFHVAATPLNGFPDEKT